MKQIIRLTEGDLHRIIENSVRRVLKENDVPVGKYDGADLGDVHPYYAQYPKKKAEELASWDAYDRANDRYPYNGKPIRSNGYWEKFEKPSIENDMYRSMGNPSQYDTLAEPDDYVRNDSGYGHHITPTRPNNAQGRLAMAALNTDDDNPIYNSNGEERYGAVPSMARNSKYFSNGRERTNIGKLQSDRASRETEDEWNAERPLRDIGA